MGQKREKDRELKKAYAEILARRTDAGRIACPAPEALLAIAENKIEPARRLELLDHVAACGDCMRELKLLQAIAEARDAL